MASTAACRFDRSSGSHSVNSAFLSSPPPPRQPAPSPSPSRRPSTSQTSNEFYHPGHQSQPGIGDDDQPHLEEELTFDYLSQPNENLICPICGNPFLDPVMCESADHIFCRKCLLRCLELSATCPIDRQPLTLSLLSPSPKIVTKLVDELLVSCPFKSSMNCPFVCQRDLMASHTRSHRLQAAHCQSPPQPGGSAISGGTCVQSIVALQHHPGPPQQPPLMQFQLLSGRATLVEESPVQKLSSHNPQIKLSQDLLTSSCSSTELSPSSSQTDPKPCPFARFGCLFVGTPDMLNRHVSTIPDQSVSSDLPKCPFYSVQEILHWFEHLETRNNELKQQLSHSLVQRGELVSDIESLQSNFRKLWQSRQNDLGPALINSAPHLTQSTCSSVGAPTSVFSMTQPHEPSSAYMNMPCATALELSGLDSFPHSSSSRLNYDRRSGQRIRHLGQLPSSLQSCPPYYISPLPSPSLTSQPSMKVSTFARKGNLLIPQPSTRASIVTPAESSEVTPSSLSAPIEQGAQHTAPSDGLARPPLDPLFSPLESSHNPPSSICQKLAEVIHLLQKSLSTWQFDRIQSSTSEDSRTHESCLALSSEIDCDEALGPVHQMIVLSALREIENVIGGLMEHPKGGSAGKNSGAAHHLPLLPSSSSEPLSISASASSSSSSSRPRANNESMPPPSPRSASPFYSMVVESIKP